MRRIATPLLVAWLAASALAGASELPAVSPANDPLAERWLAEVAPLITPAERAAYLALTRRYQRSAFERKFWEVRDPHPETPANEFADSWRERAPAALARWGSFDDARALVFAAAGEPRAELRVSCGELLLPAEIWTLGEAGRVRGGYALVFVSRGVTERVSFRIWDPREGIATLSSRGASSIDAPRGTAATMSGAGDRGLFQQIASTCSRGPEITSLLQIAVRWDELSEQAGLLPQPGDEWLRAFASMSTDLPERAETLAAELDFRYPAQRGLRTLVEGAIRLAGELPAAAAFQLEGEVLRDEELFEQFRYRFQAKPGAAVPFVFERPLRPGSYRFVLRLHQIETDRYYREVREVEVPAVAAPAPHVVLAAREPAGPETVAAAVEPAAPAIPARDEPSLRLLVPTDRLVTGKLRVEAATRGEEIAAIAFSVDGKPMLRKLRPPFGVELDLGKSPRMRRIGAVAYDAAGAELARQEMVVNGGPHRFALRLVEPRSIPAGAERVVARAEIELPEGERLDRVEFHVNDQLYATLFQEPFVQSLPIVAGTDVAWIRAVAFLRGGGAAEDVKLVGAEGLNEELDVDLVELHASVLDRQSRPVLGLGPAEFQVYEDGVRQELRRCEFQTDLPIHAGVMIDTSSSMAEELADAQRAALQFFTEVLTERDRGAIVTFAEVPDLEVRFTNSVEVLAGGLSGIEAEGNTHLWDAVAFALHYFSGLRSKRILVLITDGEDSGSRFTYDEVLDYARRTGVAIYVIGLDVPSKAEVELRIDRLARETGGRSFRIGHARELGGIYREIQTELRSQYLIAYQSSAGTGNDFREVEVRLTRPGLEARTLRGYYP